MDQHDQLDDKGVTIPLIYDFFRAHFAFNNTIFPIRETQIPNLELVESKEYKRIRKLLIQHGQIHMEVSRDRMAVTIQDFLPGLQHPCGQNSFERLSEELFEEGIKWHLMLTYFVFCAELSFQAEKQGSASVEDIINWMANYINKHLFQWIIENGGWNGLATYLFPDADNLPSKSNGLPKQQDLPQQNGLPVDSTANGGLPEKPACNLYGVGAAALALTLGLYLAKP